MWGRSGSDSFVGGEGDDVAFGGSGNDSFLGSFSGLPRGEGDDVAFGGSGDDFFDGVEFVAGDDWMVGGPGDDVFDYTHPALFFRGEVPIGNDTIIGGSGTDRVQFSSPGFFLTPSGVIAGTAAVVVDLQNGTFSTAEVSGIIVGVEEIIGSRHADTILGSSRAESLSGSFGDDYIEGRGGKDRLDGGWGLDTLNGGPGGDEFVFNAIFRFPFIVDSAADVIEDFTPGSDELLFDNTAYEALGAEEEWGAGDERFYAAAGATSGHDADDRLIYNTTIGDLYYDADGSGAGAALPVASLQGAPTLAASDITVI
jgi:Ca2+-binding RTX toxin-like protein